MPDNPMLWIISPTGAVETFFPCEQGAEPAVPPGYVLSRVAPARAADVPRIRVITLAAFLARLTPAEYKGMRNNDYLDYAFGMQLAEKATVNLDSPRMPQLLGLAVQVGAITPARAVALQRDGTADEAAG
jgi:hypothetical protein